MKRASDLRADTSCVSILSALQHRATIERATSTMVDGSPVRSWSVVSVRMPCLYSRESVVLDPSDASERREATQVGLLFTLPEADIEPGDRVHITRPPLAGSFEVEPDPSSTLTPHTVSHREFRIRSL